MGSQRAALRDPALVPTYAVAREAAPSAFVIANIGISQLLDQPGERALSAEDIERVVLGDTREWLSQLGYATS